MSSLTDFLFFLFFFPHTYLIAVSVEEGVVVCGEDVGSEDVHRPVLEHVVVRFLWEICEGVWGMRVGVSVGVCGCKCERLCAAYKSVRDGRGDWDEPVPLELCVRANIYQGQTYA